MTVIDLLTNDILECGDATLPKTVLALGNFDGVHLGHAELLKEAVRKSKSLGGSSESVVPGVWLFRAPPSDFLTDPPIPHLSTLEEKLSIFRSFGIRYAFIGEFPILSALSPEEFARRLISECNCIHAVCGFNYTFGHRGAGTPKELSAFLGGRVSVIASVGQAGSPVSSTRIRALLRDGDVRAAATLLGRPYSLTAPVLHGKALGRTISFPTANQAFPQGSVIPKSGIYAVTVHFPWEVPDAIHYGVANVGLRPTVENSSIVNCETYIFDYSGDLYDKTIEIRFIERLRDERKMSGLAELTAAITHDAEAARDLFGI